MIFVLRVTTNKEDQALDMVAERATKKQLNVYSIVRIHGMRGYVFIEAADHETAQEACFNLPYVKGVISKEINYDEIKNLIEPVATAINIEKNDVVEIIGDLFKKEKAKVIRVDKVKEEVVVELLGAAVPIPITVKIDNVRVIRREKEEEERKSSNVQEE
ncbi:MAG: transcription elongation factor Spt5 [archaeon]